MLIIFVIFALNNATYIMTIHWDESLKRVVQTTCDMAAKYIALIFDVIVQMTCQFRKHQVRE